MNQKQSEKIIDYILKNVSKLSPEKITALGSVVLAAQGINEIEHEPNTIPTVVEEDELLEDHPIDFSEVQGIELDGRRVQTKIFKSN